METTVSDGTSGPSGRAVIISPEMINTFLDVYAQVFPRDTMPKPDRSLRRLVRNAESLGNGLFINGDWLFEISSGAVLKETGEQLWRETLTKIVRLPTFSRHARERLEERFGLKTDSKETRMRAALEIVQAAKISKRQKVRLGLRNDADARQFDDRVYIMMRGFKVVTVLHIVA